MNDLSLRANVSHHKIGKKSLIRFESHRLTLFTAWHAYKKGVLRWEEPADILMFDSHDDGIDPICGESRIQGIYNNKPDQEAFLSFVEWELNNRSDDWVKAGMELGLFRNVVMVGVNDEANFKRGKNTYHDRRGNMHEVWLINHIWDELEYQGDLVDAFRKSQLQSLWDFFCWDGRSFIDETEHTHPLIVDFDLDCFSGTITDATIAWPSDILYNRFIRESKYLNNEISAAKFVMRCINRSEFVTVAMESGCCGGICESVSTLRVLDKLFCNSALFTR